MPEEIENRLDVAIRKLLVNQYPVGCKKLTDSDNEYRIRVGDYRVIYFVDEANQIVFIVDADHRKNIYRN